MVKGFLQLQAGRVRDGVRDAKEKDEISLLRRIFSHLSGARLRHTTGKDFLWCTDYQKVVKITHSGGPPESIPTSLSQHSCPSVS